MTDTYTLPDGSPRFGVRTDEPEAAETAAGGSARDVRTVAREADELDALELQTALQYRYRLGSRKADEALIAGLRSAHPEELRAAEEILQVVLVSPKEWWSLARRDRMRQITNDLERLGVVGPQMAALAFGQLVLTMLPLVAWFLASAVHAPDPLAFGVMIAASMAVAPYQRRLKRRTRGLMTPNIHTEDRAMLWADAVDATLADVLEGKSGVDPAALTAARRAWQHNLSAAAKAHELAYG